MSSKFHFARFISVEKSGVETNYWTLTPYDEPITLMSELHTLGSRRNCFITQLAMENMMRCIIIQSTVSIAMWCILTTCSQCCGVSLDVQPTVTIVTWHIITTYAQCCMCRQATSSRHGNICVQSCALGVRKTRFHISRAFECSDPLKSSPGSHSQSVSDSVGITST